MARAGGSKPPEWLSTHPSDETRIEELAARFPDLSSALLAVVDRIEDLLRVTKNNYYHPEMRGSWSIKDVLPTVAPVLQ